MQDTSLSWGQSTVLEALADGTGTVLYTWFKDGQQVAFGARHSIVGKGNLKILFAEESDSGTYKVIAKSASGEQIEASAKLIIQCKLIIFLFLRTFSFSFSFFYLF